MSRVKPKPFLVAVTLLWAWIIACGTGGGGVSTCDRIDIAFTLPSSGDSFDVFVRVCAPSVESSQIRSWIETADSIDGMALEIVAQSALDGTENTSTMVNSGLELELRTSHCLAGLTLTVRNISNTKQAGVLIVDAVSESCEIELEGL